MKLSPGSASSLRFAEKKARTRFSFLKACYLGHDGATQSTFSRRAASSPSCSPLSCQIHASDSFSDIRLSAWWRLQNQKVAFLTLTLGWKIALLGRFLKIRVPEMVFPLKRKPNRGILRNTLMPRSTALVLTSFRILKPQPSTA